MSETVVGSSLNVFFSDPVLINQFIYERWLKGLNAESTAKELRNKQTQTVGAVDDRYFYLIQNETVYQYRIFDQIVKLLAGTSNAIILFIQNRSKVVHGTRKQL
jgi:hypothetical protein